MDNSRKHAAHALIEVDVTKARELISKYKNEKSRDISFTGWIIKCIAQTVSEHKVFNSYRVGRKKIVFFDDVDIPLPVERIINGKTKLMVYILRKSNEKTLDEITSEIRTIQNETITESTQVLGKSFTFFEKIILNSPFFIKKLTLMIIRKRGMFKKKHMGTVGVTSIGMKGKYPGWAIPMGGITTSLIVIGGVTKKPGVVYNKIEIREYLHLTITIDHDLIDGGPLVRFVERLNELIENAYLLSE